MTNKLFKGIIPALITPVNQDGTLRESAVEEMVDYYIECGVNGFFICGSAGEGPALSEKTRMDMAETIVKHNKGRVAVINHIGAPDSISSLRLARHAQEIGCDAIASLPPEYYFSHPENEIFDYYKKLSESCELPFLAYFTNQFKLADISSLVSRLFQLDHFVGVKFTRYNCFEMQKVLELNDGNINVINGSDGQLVCGLLYGVDAGIGSTYNIMPREYVEMYRRFQAGDIIGARDMQHKINHVTALLVKHNVVASIKYLLNYRGFDVGDPVFPSYSLNKEQGKQLIENLTKIGFFEDFTF